MQQNNTYTGEESMKTIVVTDSIRIPISTTEDLFEDLLIEYKATLELRNNEQLQNRPFSSVKEIRLYFKNQDNNTLFPVTDCVPAGLQTAMFDAAVNALMKAKIIKAPKG